MTKKILALTIALVLCAGVANAGLCEDGDAKPWLVPEEFAEAFNMVMSNMFMSMESFDENTRNEAINYFALHYTETAYNIVYYNNTDWGLELSGYYDDIDADSSIPASSITFTIAEAYNIDDMLTMIGDMLVDAMLVLDDSADVEEIKAMIQKGWSEGVAMMDAEHYSLSALYYQQRYAFVISPRVA